MKITDRSLDFSCNKELLSGKYNNTLRCCVLCYKDMALRIPLLLT